MKQTAIAMTLGFALLGLSACTTQPEILNDTSKVPVVQRSKVDTTHYKEFIILMPAGTEIAFNAKVHGDAFMKNVKKTFMLKLKRDTYMYVADSDNPDAANLWVSHDKKHWKTLMDAYEGTLSLNVDVTAKDASIDLDFEANSK